MSEIYKIFFRDERYDFGDQSLIDMYNQESYGTDVSPLNGYYWGKKWMNITIKSWKEDIKLGILLETELYNDPTFPHWWLDKVFPQGKNSIDKHG
jgi:hypothetical protein